MNSPIIILHGWGLSGNKYLETQKILEKERYKVYVPDLPGFGYVEMINNSMVLGDYVSYLKKFLEKENLEKVILVGHSFGGRVSVKFAAKYPEMVEKIILTGAPLLRPKLGIKKYIVSKIVVAFGFMKKYFPLSVALLLRKFIYKFIGEYDYLKADKMKQTFVNIINEDLANIIRKITIPVLLIWGENDKLVSIEIAKKVQKMIKNSKLTIVENQGHALPYKNSKIFSNLIINFLKNK